MTTSPLKRYDPTRRERFALWLHNTWAHVASWWAEKVDWEPMPLADRLRTFVPRCAACNACWPEYETGVPMWQCPACGVTDATEEQRAAEMCPVRGDMFWQLMWLEQQAGARLRGLEDARLLSLEYARRWARIILTADVTRKGSMSLEYQWWRKVWMEAATRSGRELRKRLLTTTTTAWWDPLGREPRSLEDARRLYHDRVVKVHPDHGGDPKEFQRLRNAWKRARVRWPAPRGSWS